MEDRRRPDMVSASLALFLLLEADRTTTEQLLADPPRAQLCSAR